jgi:hypothetical protein
VLHDRILTTALERLDMNRGQLRDGLIIFLFTSNVPELVDSAFARRAGSLERFGRLSRRSFAAVIEKRLHGLPLRAEQGQPTVRGVTRRVTDWLYSPNGGDPGQVEITFVGSSTPVVKYRRDFMTAALVARAVEDAAAAACREERLGRSGGLTAEMVMAALVEEVRRVAGVLTRDNVHNHVDLPDGARAGEVRRLEQPLVQPFEIETRP